MSVTYKCPNCGNNVTTEQQVSNLTCPYCGNSYNTASNQQPPQFGGNQQGQQQQQQYGYQQQPPYGQPQYGYQQPYRSNDVFAEGPSGKSRGIAALLAILLGAIGVHYFYLGKTTPGVVFLVASLLSCGILAAVTSIIGLIQGIMMFCMSQEEFENKYVNPAVSFPLF
jgi:TM2 domain-containing membrane protein YozV